MLFKEDAIFRSIFFKLKPAVASKLVSANVHLTPKVSKYSRECKSLTGKLVKPVSKPQSLSRFLSGVVCREAFTEGSGTTKSNTDEQERHKRLFEVGKQAQLVPIFSGALQRF